MPRLNPYVCVTKVKGQAVLQVEFTDDKKQTYPLTFENCRQAGRDLFNAGAESWTNSSSVDFPQETSPGFRGDVRELMGQGYQQEMDKAGKPRKATIAKMLAHCSKPDFIKTLTPAELKAFIKIKSEYKE